MEDWKLFFSTVLGKHEKNIAAESSPIQNNRANSVPGPTGTFGLQRWPLYVHVWYEQNKGMYQTLSQLPEGRACAHSLHFAVRMEAREFRLRHERSQKPQLVHSNNAAERLFCGCKGLAHPIRNSHRNKSGPPNFSDASSEGFWVLALCPLRAGRCFVY